MITDLPQYPYSSFNNRSTLVAIVSKPRTLGIPKNNHNPFVPTDIAMDMEIDTPKPEVGDEQGIKVEDLFNAAEKGESSIFRALSQAQLLKALSLRNDDCRSLIHVAASSGHAEVVTLISISVSPVFGFRENLIIVSQVGFYL